MGPLIDGSKVYICEIWGGEVQKVGVICDSTCTDEELTSSDPPDIRQEVPTPWDTIVLVSVLLRSTGRTDLLQKLHERGALNILIITRCQE